VLGVRDTAATDGLMTKQYSFRSIESISETAARTENSPNPRDFVSSDYRVTFVCMTDNPPPGIDMSALIDYPGQDHLKKMYFDAVNTPGFLATGMLHFYDYSFFETCALPIDVFRREAVIGDPILWGSDFAAWYADTHNLDALLDRALSTNYIDFIINQLRGHTIVEPTVLLSAPGQEIYGHWLLDTVARLDMLSQSEYIDTPILLNTLPQWAHFFLDVYGIDRARIRPHPTAFFKMQNAIIPSAAKSGFRLGGKSLRSAWDRLNAAYEPMDIDQDLIGEKVYVSRRNWPQSRRGFGNTEELEAYVASRGYKVVSPEKLSIPQQMRLMREARVVVGEDGSALHNVIFSVPGARLGILTLPERTNMWHLGICQLLEHKCAYYQLPDSPETAVDLDAFGGFLDAVETG